MSARAGNKIEQLPWSQTHLPYTPLKVVTEEQLEQIHRTSMRVLSEA